MGKYFGTDGVRGLANAKLTPELAFHLGLACGRILQEKTEIRAMILGRDTRRSGPMLGAALAAGFASAGLDVWTAGFCLRRLWLIWPGLRRSAAAQ